MDSISQFDHSKPDSFKIALALVGSGVFIFGSLIFAFFLYRATLSTALNTSQITPKSTELKLLQSYEFEKLNSLKWKNKEKGMVQIPVNLAMDLVVKDYE